MATSGSESFVALTTRGEEEEEDEDPEAVLVNYRLLCLKGDYIALQDPPGANRRRSSSYSPTSVPCTFDEEEEEETCLQKYRRINDKLCVSGRNVSSSPPP